MKLIKLAELSEVGVSHHPDIKKKVILDKGYIPHLMTFGQAVFKPGQGTDEHQHETMYEVFYIESGKAKFIVNGKTVLLRKGDVIVLEPKELHSQSNPYSEPTTWLYFGIAVD